MVDLYVLKDQIQKNESKAGVLSLMIKKISKELNILPDLNLINIQISQLTSTIDSMEDERLFLEKQITKKFNKFKDSTDV